MQEEIESFWQQSSPERDRLLSAFRKEMGEELDLDGQAAADELFWACAQAVAIAGHVSWSRFAYASDRLGWLPDELGAGAKAAIAKAPAGDLNLVGSIASLLSLRPATGDAFGKLVRACAARKEALRIGQGLGPAQVGGKKPGI